MCRDAEQTWPPALSKLMQVGMFLSTDQGWGLLIFNGTTHAKQVEAPSLLLVNQNTCRCKATWWLKNIWIQVCLLFDVRKESFLCPCVPVHPLSLMIAACSRW